MPRRNAASAGRRPCEPHDERRRALLKTLLFAPERTATVHWLRREMADVHGLAVSAERVRADLAWLRERGLVRSSEDAAAQITERGRDLVFGCEPWPHG